MPTKAELETMVATLVAQQAELMATTEAATAKAAPAKVTKLKPLDGFVPIMADGTKAKPTDTPIRWIGRDPRSKQIVVANHHQSTRGPKASQATYEDRRTGEQKVPKNAYSGVAIPVAVEAALLALLTE